MKSFVSVMTHFIKQRPLRSNAITLGRFVLTLIVMITLYSILFHLIMRYEGRDESWITGVYWTLTVMSTLGFGDITFASDLGRLFSIVVMVSGVFFLLVLLPFTFIELFYVPWMQAQQQMRAPRQLSKKMEGHVLITSFDPVIKTLIERLNQYHYPYVIIEPDMNEALRLHDMGYQVMLGELDDPATYVNARVAHAKALVSMRSDQVNANIAFTAREVSESVPIIVSANLRESVDNLELAGATWVLELTRMMGEALARQVASGANAAHTIGAFDDLIIADSAARGTDLVGKTLAESRLGEETGLNVIGVWRRGHFENAQADTKIGPNTVLVMAGTQAAIERYNALYYDPLDISAPIIIIGGGRVGRQAARTLVAKGLDYRIVEKSPERMRNPEKYVIGDAGEIDILEKAGINEATSIVITTHDDDMNVYLTIYCRRLRPDAHIISRANLDRNVATLHRAGADFVMSLASTGAAAVINAIGRENILMVSEGLDIFELEVPKSLIGKTIAEADIRARTGCTVVALRSGDHTSTLPDPHAPLPWGGRLVMIGVPSSEDRFMQLYQG